MKVWKHLLWGTIVFAVFAAVYCYTAQRGVSWQDSGGFQERMIRGDWRGDLGLACAHPLYIALGHLVWLVTHSVYTLNAFSGIGLAVANALLFGLVWHLTGRKIAGVLAAILFGLAQMPWWMGTITEVYTWSSALLALELLMFSLALRNERLWPLVFLVNGIGFSFHDFALLTLPLIIWFCPRRRSMWTWPLGALPLLLLIPAEIAQVGVIGAVKSVLFGKDWATQVMSSGGANWKLVGFNFALAGISLCNPAWRFAVMPLFKAEGKFYLFLRCALGIHALFFIRYFVPDQATFILPTLLLLAVWAGVGVARLSQQTLIRICGISAMCAVLVPQAVLLLAQPHMPQRVRDLPFRNEASYWLIPWKHHEDSAQRFANAVRQQIGTSLLYADGTSSSPLRADALTSGHPAPSALSYGDSGWEIPQEPPFYVVSPARGYAPGWLFNGNYRWEQEGVLYRCYKIDQ